LAVENRRAGLIKKVIRQLLEPVQQLQLLAVGLPERSHKLIILDKGLDNLLALLLDQHRCLHWVLLLSPSLALAFSFGLLLLSLGFFSFRLFCFECLLGRFLCTLYLFLGLLALP